MRRKSAEKSAASEWPCSEGQGEHVSVHRDIFGPKGMLAFAPRFFKNRNLRKMSSAKPQPQGIGKGATRSTTKRHPMPLH